MEFEFDAQKSHSNRVKHGIDFSAAQLLWNDPDRLEFSAKTEDESRILVIGKIDGKMWTAVITPRDKKTRIISVRKSREKEVLLYESKEF